MNKFLMTAAMILFGVSVPVLTPAYAFDMGHAKIDNCRSGTNFDRCGQGNYAGHGGGDGRITVTTEKPGKPFPPKCDHGEYGEWKGKDKWSRHGNKGGEQQQAHNDSGDKGTKGGQGNRGENHTGEAHGK